MTKADFIIMLLCAAAEQLKLDYSCINRLIFEIKQKGISIGDVLDDASFSGSVWHNVLERAGEMRQGCGNWLENLSRRKIYIISTENPHYPSNLLNKLKEKTPPCFLAVGNSSLAVRPSVAVTGVREVFEEDVKFARRVGELCARERLVAVSGGAAGVDTAVLEAVLEKGGEAVVYLPQGFEKSRFMQMNRRYTENGALLCLSLFMPGQEFTSKGALERNIYIHTHGDITVTVRAKYKSGGSWSGAYRNLQRGKTPAFVSDIPSPGNEALRELGATVLKRKDISAPGFRLGSLLTDGEG